MGHEMPPLHFTNVFFFLKLLVWTLEANQSVMLVFLFIDFGFAVQVFSEVFHANLVDL